jgi:hypothetical protein
MISNEEILQFGFEYNIESGEYERGINRISVEDGKVVFIRQKDNYHGLYIKPIDNIATFIAVYLMLFNE